MSPTLHTQFGVPHRCKEVLGDILSSIEHNKDNLIVAKNIIAHNLHRHKVKSL